MRNSRPSIVLWWNKVGISSRANVKRQAAGGLSARGPGALPDTCGAIIFCQRFSLNQPVSFSLVVARIFRTFSFFGR